MLHSGADLKNWRVMYHTDGEFKDFKDHFQNSRTFQGSSNILTEIQGLFKDRHEIQGFQGFFQGCGNPAIVSNVQMLE